MKNRTQIEAENRKLKETAIHRVKNALTTQVRFGPEELRRVNDDIIRFQGVSFRVKITRSRDKGIFYT